MPEAMRYFEQDHAKAKVVIKMQLTKIYKKKRQKKGQDGQRKNI